MKTQMNSRIHVQWHTLRSASQNIVFTDDNNLLVSAVHDVFMTAAIDDKCLKTAVDDKSLTTAVDNVFSSADFFNYGAMVATVDEKRHALRLKLKCCYQIRRVKM